jgi:hypothetical protein
MWRRAAVRTSARPSRKWDCTCTMSGVNSSSSADAAANARKGGQMRNVGCRRVGREATRCTVTPAMVRVHERAGGSATWWRRSEVVAAGGWCAPRSRTRGRRACGIRRRCADIPAWVPPGQAQDEVDHRRVQRSTPHTGGRVGPAATDEPTMQRSRVDGVGRWASDRGGAASPTWYRGRAT